jgi:hypothetical protein
MTAYDDSPFIGHVCNALCQSVRGIHAVLTYSTRLDRTLEYWQQEGGGFEVLESRLAPEAPTISQHLNNCPEFEELLVDNGYTAQGAKRIFPNAYA